MSINTSLMQNFGLEDLSHVRFRRNIFKISCSSGNGFWLVYEDLSIDFGRRNKHPKSRYGMQTRWRALLEPAISPSRKLGLRYFFITIRSFHFFWILLIVSLTIAKAREKLTKRGLNRKNSHTEKCIEGLPQLHLHLWKVQIKRLELWED